MDCQHRWIIRAARLGSLPAVCKKCGARRAFPLEANETEGALKWAPKRKKVGVGQPDNI